ncbi:sterol 26-hydroxylase, mitochondrial-like [Protopterus annectens]|uniref:sterol 26-hydroxylase, mitochondrial-like n=1 Tax=Protopterus annectens TaxID=7888 RepID=UPI001CFA8DF0|nr:sterol 26-hydroxylase, mitochondrial-like [Protopterus annectens]
MANLSTKPEDKHDIGALKIVGERNNYSTVNILLTGLYQLQSHLNKNKVLLAFRRMSTHFFFTMIKPLLRLPLLPWSRLLYSSRACVLSKHMSSASTTTTNSMSPVNTHKEIKSVDDLPGFGMWKSLYWLIIRGYLLRTHELQIVHKKIYGPIWKSRFGRYENINVADASLMEQVLRHEGRFPRRVDNIEWKEYRALRKLEYGPFLQEGERWYNLRTVLNQKLLKPKEAKLYDQVINQVVTDLVKRFYWLRENKGAGAIVPDVVNELYRFGFEGISSIVFETRLGCLEKNVPKETQDFINSVGNMLYYFILVIVIPKWAERILPFYNKYIEAWDTIFNYAKKLIDKKMDQIQARLDRQEPVEGEYLTYLLSDGRLTQSEIYSAVTEVLLAGVDTTSNTLSWSLYHLAKEQDIQDALYQEIISITPGTQIPTAQDVDRMPLLKAVIKETLRLYPVVPTNSRVLENDIVLNGYCIPRESLFILNHYAASMDEKDYPDAFAFRPERWIRGKEVLKRHPFSSLPFGYGVRACLGRRIAELEMHLSLARLMKHFQVKPDPKKKIIHPRTRTLMTPGSQMDLQFLDRSSSA